jgi:MerR family transcriptional regulator, light-induced transcriptional regulator
MYQFTIRDIENLCGIKAHTLRIWEQRYNLVTPKRKESKHRLYDNEDLKKLLRISVLYHRGWKISKIAQLRPPEIISAINDTAPGTEEYHYHLAQLIEKAIDFDKEGLVQQLERMIQNMGFEKTVVQICYPLLQKIGTLWMTDRLIPAQEHFCSYIIQHKIIAETDKLPAPPKEAPEILLFSPHGEHHELPLYFLNYLLRKNGWTTLYLGTNVKMDLLKQFAVQKNITHLFLHIITNFTGFGLDDYFDELCKTFRDKQVVASGAAIFSVQRTFTNLLLLKSDEAIYQFVQKGHATSAAHDSLHPRG